MKQTITLRGAQITSVGRLFKLSVAEAARRIEEGGGTYSYEIRAGLTCFVEGSQAGNKATKAHARGIPAITEAQFLTLLEAGTLEREIPDPFASKATFDESVAELRAIFNAQPSSQGWTRCLEIVEGCDPERIDDLLAYTQPFVAAWDDTTALDSWRCPKDHPLMAHAPEDYWLPSLPKHELRVAPPRWVHEIIQGQHHPKHGLARALCLTWFKLNGALGKKILESPYLRHLRYLDLGSSNSFSLTFYRELRTNELVRTVRILVVSVGTDGIKLIAREWAYNHHCFDALEEVRSPSTLVSYDEDQRRYMRIDERALPCFKGVRFRVNGRLDEP
jgi:hypothetical protein